MNDLQFVQAPPADPEEGRVLKVNALLTLTFRGGEWQGLGGVWEYVKNAWQLVQQPPPVVLEPAKEQTTTYLGYRL